MRRCGGDASPDGAVTDSEQILGETKKCEPAQRTHKHTHAHAHTRAHLFSVLEIDERGPAMPACHPAAHMLAAVFSRPAQLEAATETRPQCRRSLNGAHVAQLAAVVRFTLSHCENGASPGALKRLRAL